MDRRRKKHELAHRPFQHIVTVTVMVMVYFMGGGRVGAASHVDVPAGVGPAYSCLMYVRGSNHGEVTGSIRKNVSH